MGIEISKAGDGKTAKEFGLQEVKPVQTPMDLSYGKTRLYIVKLFGCLLYISVNTRPNV